MSGQREKIARIAAEYPLPKTAAVWGICYDTTCGREEVWICRSSGPGDPSVGCNPWAIATPFTISGRLEMRDGAGIRVKLEDMGGAPRIVDLPRSVLQSRTQTMRLLLANGIRLGRDGEDFVMRVLRSANPPDVVQPLADDTF